MEVIYLVIVNSEQYTNDVVSICTTREIAEDLKTLYEKNCSDNGYEAIYTITEVKLDPNKNVLWEATDE